MASKQPRAADLEPRSDEGSKPQSEPRHAAPCSVPYIVLVGLDLSEPGGRAWRFAFELAAMKGESSEVHAVVMGARAIAPEVRDVPTRAFSRGRDPREFEEPSAPSPIKVLEHRSPSGEAKLMAMHFRTGPADRAILKLAAELGADVIVVATHPTSRIQKWLGRSVADCIAQRARCPVVVVRPKDEENDPGVSECAEPEESRA